MNGNASGNWMFVGAAFVVTWVVLIGYFIHLRRTMRNARALAGTSTARSQ